ncbi:branched-chain amino acid transaminase [Brevibacillus sp. SYP-B805]|uniref:branched-chain amino acid transaminase n=1 Tax=Brevibacillus sp. SYP-B805 TaxID=1578199 RepID=UPI0032164401
MSYAYFEGAVVPLEEAKVSIATHALNYGTGVFEGIRAYWNKEQKQLYVLKGPEHYVRMVQSCRIMKIHLQESIDDMMNATVEILRRSGYQEDVYIRPLAYKADPVIKVKLSGIRDAFAIFTVPLGDYLDVNKGLHLGISPWRRLDDNAIPTRAKATGSYINAALAVDDLIESGFDDGIMLTQDGHVAEGTAANLFMVRGGKLITSPVTDAILEGITRSTLLELAKDAGINVEIRSIDRTELYVADELFLCGTGVQVAPVTRVDHRPVGSGAAGELTLQLQKLYFDAVRGNNPAYRHWLTPVYA